MWCGCSHSSVNKFLGILMSNIKNTGHMENCFKLIIFIFIRFLDFERKVRYVFLIEMTQFTLVFVWWLEWHLTCYCPFTYWCH